MTIQIKRERERALKARAAATTALGALVAGALLGPAATATGAVEDLESGTPTRDILAGAALDDRLADDGVTPIAVRGGTDAHGNEIVYGARASTTPAVADLDAEIDGTRYFVDCSASVAGTGTHASPFDDLAAINAVDLDPGDHVLFRRGAACTGMFEPRGSGTAEAPVVVDAYDAAASSMARIDAAGAPQAVFLHDVEHYTVRNLELTNYTGDARDYAPGSVRRGLTVSITDMGVGAGFTLTDLYIHDVLGEGKKDNGGSGGIQLEVHGRTTPTKYTDVEIAYNTIRNVNRSGINMSTVWWGRPEAHAGNDRSYYAWDPMFIHDNVVTDVGGDGIVLQYASGSRVENNTVENVSNTADGRSMNGANAAVWPWNADHVAFRYNHVFSTVRGPDNNDGQAFDADYGGTGTLFEHNLTHDNKGGFMMFCGCWGISSATVARYNVSLNDGRAVPLENGTTGIARTFFMAGQTDGEVYNNTILLPSSPVDIAHPDLYLADNLVLANNLFLAQEDTVVQETASDLPDATIVWRDNVFGGTASGWPTLGAEDNSIVPDLGLADGAGLDQLRIAHPAVLGTGAPVAPEGTLDFFGSPVPWVTSPDVGAVQLSPVDVAAQTTLSDGGFERAAGDSPWELTGSARHAADGARTGSGALAFGPGAGAATTTARTAVNRTYRLVAAVRADDGAAPPTVSLTLPSGATESARPAPGATPDEDGFWPVTLVVRTSTDASTLDVTVSSEGGAGVVDDISLLEVEDRMVDGSFEAARNTVWQRDNSNTWDLFPRSDDATTGLLASPVSADAPASNRFTYVEPGVDYELGVWAKAAAGARIALGWTNAAGESAEVSTGSTTYTRLAVPLTSSTAQLTVSCTGTGTCDDMTLVPAWDGAVPAVVAPETLEVTFETGARCVVGRTVLTARVTNDAGVPVAADISTAYGTRSTDSLGAGRSMLHAFTTRQGRVPAGEMSVTVSAMVDGEAVTRVVDVPYPAHSCV